MPLTESGERDDLLFLSYLERFINRRFPSGCQILFGITELLRTLSSLSFAKHIDHIFIAGLHFLLLEKAEF